jgi:hypothetical protein
LTAEFFRAFPNEFGPGESAGVDADFIRAGAQHGEHVVHGLESAANGERHEALISGTFNHVHHRLAAVRCGGDVKKYHFVGALLVVPEGEFHGVADVAEFTGLGFAKLDAARDLAGVNIEARNDSFGNHTIIKGGVAPEGKWY